MTFENPIQVNCDLLWRVMEWGLNGLKHPESLTPDQFLEVTRKMIEALMLYYVKCGP